MPLSSHNGYSKGRRKSQIGSVATPKNFKGFRLGIQIVKHALEENCSSGVRFALHGNVQMVGVALSVLTSESLAVKNQHQGLTTITHNLQN